ncbi:hypothetical protein LI291_10775 [Intestinibacillus massiliensis]|nr:hypothetical protein [Intestinibacillus massiliensis]
MNIDELSLEINTDAGQAVDGIGVLVDALESLKSVLPVKGLASVADGLGQVSAAARKVGNLNALDRFARSVGNISRIQPMKIGSTLNTLKKLPELVNAVNAMPTMDGGKISAVAEAVRPFETMGKNNINPFLSSLNKLPPLVSAINAMPAIDTTKIQSIALALRPMEGMGKNSMGSFVNTLKKLPEIATSLNGMEMGKFADSIQRVATAMQPLADEMYKVSAGFSRLPPRMQSVIRAQDRLATSSRGAGKSFGGLNLKTGVLALAYHKLASWVGNALNKSNEYIENLNLFTVAMGDGAEAALDYARTVQDALGIDMSEFIRNQGMFKQILSGFGVVEDKANLMSKNLTQIGYDISSFYNISIEDAMQKVESGIAGEIEPLRRLGYAIDVATLQEVAYKHGIDAKVNSMNQAAKSQLRYIAIMEQSGNVMGDMARTIITPANSMRILAQQSNMLVRAIGNIASVIAVKIIPWIQAFISILIDAANALASLFGFKPPTIDYSSLGGLASGADEAAGSLDGVGDAAKKAGKAVAKSFTLGIDELNVLDDSASAAANALGGSGGLSGGDLGIEMPEYDFLSGLAKQAEDVKQKMSDILEVVVSIASALLGWHFARSFTDWLTKLLDLKIPAKVTIGIALAASGAALGAENIGEILLGNYKAASLQSAIKEAVSGLLVGAGMIAMGASAWAIPVAMSLVVGITEIVVNWERIKTMWGQIFDGIKALLDGDIQGFWGYVSQAFLTWMGGDSWTIELAKKIAGEDAWNAAIQFLENGGTIDAAFKTLFSNVGKSISEWWDESVAPWFTAEKWAETAQGMALGVGLKWSETVTAWKEAISSWWENNVAPWFTKERWEDLMYSIGYQMGESVRGIVSLWTKDIPDWWKNNVMPWFTAEKWSSLYISIKSELVKKWNETVGAWINAISTWWEDNVAPWFTLEKWKRLFSSIKDAVVSTISNFVSSWKTSIQDWWNNDVKKWFSWETWQQLGKDIVDGLLNGIGDLWETAKDFALKFIGGFRDGVKSHSPSREMKKIGIDLNDGLALASHLFFETDVTAAKQFIHGFAPVVDEIQKMFDGISYSPNIDYMELINEAKANGDLAAAAQYEQQRNAKIQGEGLSYELTSEFTKPLETQLTATNGTLSAMNDKTALTATQLANMSAADKAAYAADLRIATDTKAQIEAVTKRIETVMRANTMQVSNSVSGLHTYISGSLSSMLNSYLSSILDATRNIRIEIYNNYYSGGSKLATGGVVKKRTLVTVGEYSGASSNPEIVAPQDMMRETVAEANEPMFAALLDGMERMIAAIEDKDMNLQIGDETIGRANDRYKSKRGAYVSKGVYANAY